MKKSKQKYVALVGDCPLQAQTALESLECVEKVFVLPPDTLVDSPIKTHPDTILCIFDGRLFCHKAYAEKNLSLLSEICKTANLILCPQDGERNGTYPHDCAYNALVVPEKSTVIGRKKSLCPPLSSIAVNCNQGYAACCALNMGGTVLTADESLLKSLKAAKINSVKIGGEDISLPGYNTGFVGGCGGFFEDTLCIFGSPENSKTGSFLASYCNENHFSLISLCSGPLTDYGGIKFLPMA